MFPSKIPIERIEEYHTHYLGKLTNGNLFWGYSTFITTKTFLEIQEIEGNWEDYRFEYAILHIFDSIGNHLQTKHHLGGTVKQIDYKTLFKKLESMISELGNFEFQDIEVCPFQVEIDNVIFGLVPNESYGVIELQPNSSLAFGPPWDGSYDT
jgi:hypothetical protein